MFGSSLYVYKTFLRQRDKSVLFGLHMYAKMIFIENVSFMFHLKKHEMIFGYLERICP